MHLATVFIVCGGGLINQDSLKVLTQVMLNSAQLLLYPNVIQFHASIGFTIGHFLLSGQTRLMFRSHCISAVELKYLLKKVIAS